MAIYRVLIMTAAVIFTAVAFMPAKIYAMEEMSATGKVTNETLNIRTGPGTEYDVLGQFHTGDSVDITGSEDGWYRIEYDEEVGYVSAKYVELTDDTFFDEETDEDIEDTDESATDDALQADEEKEEQKGNGGLFADKKTILIIAGVIILLVILISATLISIRNMSDEYDEYEDPDFDEYYDDDEYDEEYDDEYDDEYEDDGYDDDEYYDEDEYDDEYDDEYEDEEEFLDDDDEGYYDESDNYRVKIDPRYFSD